MGEPKVIGAIACPGKGFVRNTIEDAGKVVERNTRRIIALSITFDFSLVLLAIVIIALIDREWELVRTIFAYILGAFNGVMMAYGLQRAKEEHVGSGDGVVVND